jgi:hypothetical protein
VLSIFLWFNALMYLALGVWCTLLPSKTAETIGFAFTKPGARSEYITVYGGMEFGLGVFFLLAALNPVWREGGLLLGLVLYGGLALWRLYTFLTIPGITGFPRIAFVLEAVLFVAAIFLWLRRG